MEVSIELTTDRSEKVNYDYPDYPFYVRKGLLSNYPNYTAPNHWHDAIELIAVISGTMNYNVNGIVSQLFSGQGIVVNAGQMHFGYSDQRSECEFICVLIHPIALCSIPSFEQDFIEPVISNTQAPYICLSSECDWQKSIYERIISIYESRERKTAPLQILSDFSAIWSLLFEQIPPDDKKTQHPNRDLSVIKTMVQFVQKNYAKKITLSDISRSGSVGESKCYKLFLKYFSQSPIVYLTQYRLNKSIDLLRTTDMPVIEIALSVGFSGASYYSETFRKWMNKSPTEFRKELYRNIAE